VLRIYGCGEYLLQRLAMRIPFSFRVLNMAIAFMPWLISGTAAEVAVVAEAPIAKPNVIMAAEPQPPFTYWAPENSIIRNHSRQPGIWIAESRDGSLKYYFGDQCGASRFQRFIGQSLNALPEKPATATWRLACSNCAGTSNLDWTRMNVLYQQQTRTIDNISCG
jgi:hypothetical protein